jgi:hypothetical protein
LNRRSGKHLHLSPDEAGAVHEVLTWCREEKNNPVLQLFGTVFEGFLSATTTLMEKFRSVLPVGSLRARIRATRREPRQVEEQELGSTLGEEGCGMVVVDMSGVPLKYDQMTVFSDVIGRQNCRIEVDVPGRLGKGWRRAQSTVDTAAEADLGEEWRSQVQAGARLLLEETWVPANDPHLDAKCWPCIHPHGTGSLLSEAGSGGTQRLARSRLLSAQSFFRRPVAWDGGDGGRGRL